MAQTNTDRINALSREVAEISTRLNERANLYESADLAQRQDIQRLEGTVELLLQRITSLEERCKSLEKHSDRSWQIWLALLGSLLAIIVAFAKK